LQLADQKIPSIEWKTQSNSFLCFSPKLFEKPALKTVVFEKPAMKPQPTLNISLQMTSENISYKEYKTHETGRARFLAYFSHQRLSREH